MGPGDLVSSLSAQLLSAGCTTLPAATGNSSTRPTLKGSSSNEQSRDGISTIGAMSIYARVSTRLLRDADALEAWLGASIA